MSCGSSVRQDGWSCNGLTYRASTDVRLVDHWICFLTEIHPTSATSSTSSVFALESSGRLSWSVMSTLRSFRFTTRATRCHAVTRDTTPRRLAPCKASHQERIAWMSIRCCAASFPSLRWTERARACGAHTIAGRLNGHERVIRNVHSSGLPRHGTRCHALRVFHTCLCG